MEALRDVPRRIITFGLTDKADVYAENIQFVGANSSFDIMYKGRKFTDVTLHVPGMHNVKNALAATAASICLGIRPNAVKYGLAGFNGADAASSSRASITARTCMTTMPTIRAS